MENLKNKIGISGKSPTKTIAKLNYERLLESKEKRQNKIKQFDELTKREKLNNLIDSK